MPRFVSDNEIFSNLFLSVKSWRIGLYESK